VRRICAAATAAMMRRQTPPPQDHLAPQIPVGAQAREPQGRARTVNVEVRSKRTYVKREVLEDQARHQQEEIDRQRETEEQAKAALERAEHERIEKERLDRERLEEENRRRSDEENRKRTARRGAPPGGAQAREQADKERKAATTAPAKPARPPRSGRQRNPLRPSGAAHRRRRELAPQEEEIRDGRRRSWATMRTPSTVRDADGRRT